MEVTIYKEDAKAPYRQGEQLATLNIAPQKGIANRVLVNKHVYPLVDWLKQTHNTSLIVAIK